MLPIGAKILSKRAVGLNGVIVGYGVIEWPPDHGRGDYVPQQVYLVKVARGSTSLGPACLVFRHDQVEEIK